MIIRILTNRIKRKDKDQGEPIHLFTVSLKSQASNQVDVYLEEFIAANRLIIRAEFLQWIDQLSNKKDDINHSSLAESLAIPGEPLSAWWLGKISEKSNLYRSQYMNNHITLLAVLLLLREQPEPIHIYIAECPEYISACLLDYFAGSSTTMVNFKYKKQFIKAKINLIWPRIYVNLNFLYYLKALLMVPCSLFWALAYCTNRWRFFRAEAPKLSTTTYNLALISYFFHLDQNLFSTGKFVSSYWGPLVSAIQDKGICPLWVHMYIPAQSSPRECLNSFRLNHCATNSTHHHILLDTFLSLSLIARSILFYFKTLARTRFIRKRFCRQIILGPSKYLFSEYVSAFDSSTIGIDLLRSSISLHLFKELSKQMTFGSNVIYLQEGISWESSLISTLKSITSSTVHSYQYTFVRFWDLRYHSIFVDNATNSSLQPKPDFTLVSEQFFSSANPQRPSNAPSCDVESLRYNTLTYPSQYLKSNSYNKKEKCLIIFGDSDRNSHEDLIDLILKFMAISGSKIRTIFKPHPLMTHRCKRVVGSCEISALPISSFSEYATHALIGPMTGACFDVIALGITPIIFSSSLLDFSPTSELNPRLETITTADELLNAIMKDSQHSSSELSISPSRGLLKWSKLLDSIVEQRPS